MPSPAMIGVTSVEHRCGTLETHARAIDWYFPTVERDQEHLERWCHVVGPPVLDSMPSADFGSLKSGEPLAVAVWNTDVGAGDLVAFLETELGLRCAGAASGRQDGAPHVVLLVQEALRRSPYLQPVEESWATPPPVAEEERPGQRLGIDEVARRCGLAVFYAPAARNGHETRDGNGEDKGNAILSTLPLSDPIILELPFESARRVVPGATVRNAAGDSLRLLSVHLITTPQAWRVITTANSSRLRQAMAIVHGLERIEGKRGSGSPHSTRTRPISTVVAGDFNTWSRTESALRHLLLHFPQSPRPLLDDTRGPFPTDHMLFRRRTDARNASHDGFEVGSYRRIANAYYSDHHPIIGRLRFDNHTDASAPRAARDAVRHSR